VFLVLPKAWALDVFAKHLLREIRVGGTCVLLALPIAGGSQCFCKTSAAQKPS